MKQAKREAWFLYPACEQLPLRDARAAVQRLREKCLAMPSDDGSILVSGPSDVLTRDYRARLLPYVKELWVELKRQKGG